MPRTLPILQDDSFPLDDISVAAPCPAEWADMVGSDTVRFCASCQKNVFNLSGMKRADAVSLLRATEGSTCVRYFRRADGTVLTADCPVGVALLLKRAKRATLAATALSIGAVAAVLAVLAGALGRPAPVACDRLLDLQHSIEPSPAEPQPPLPMGRMGDVVLPPEQP